MASIAYQGGSKLPKNLVLTKWKTPKTINTWLQSGQMALMFKLSEVRLKIPKGAVMSFVKSFFCVTKAQLSWDKKREQKLNWTGNLCLSWRPRQAQKIC